MAYTILTGENTFISQSFSEDNFNALKEFKDYFHNFEPGYNPYKYILNAESNYAYLTFDYKEIKEIFDFINDSTFKIVEIEFQLVLIEESTVREQEFSEEKLIYSSSDLFNSTDFIKIFDLLQMEVLGSNSREDSFNICSGLRCYNSYYVLPFKEYKIKQVIKDVNEKEILKRMSCKI